MSFAYTEGEQNLMYYAKHGRFPPPPPIPNRTRIRTNLGNGIAEIVRYRGERGTRQIQTSPYLLETERQIPGALESRTPLRGLGDMPLGDMPAEQTKAVDWIPIIAIALGLMNFLRN